MVSDSLNAQVSGLSERLKSLETKVNDLPETMILQIENRLLSKLGDVNLQSQQNRDRIDQAMSRTDKLFSYMDDIKKLIPLVEKYIERLPKLEEDMNVIRADVEAQINQRKGFRGVFKDLSAIIMSGAALVTVIYTMVKS